MNTRTPTLFIGGSVFVRVVAAGLWCVMAGAGVADQPEAEVEAGTQAHDAGQLVIVGGRLSPEHALIYETFLTGVTP
ncbi:MAG: hypothetical protein AAGL98_13090, partial [Planctomycetota bacterium]